MTKVLYPGIKQSWREGYRLSKSSAEVTNEWMYISTLTPACLHCVYYTLAVVRLLGCPSEESIEVSRFEEFLSSSPGRFFVIRDCLFLCVCLSVRRLITFIQLITSGSHSLPKRAIATEPLPRHKCPHTAATTKQLLVLYLLNYRVVQ